MPTTAADDSIASIDSQLQAGLDTLVHRASLGDRRAIGAIAVAYGPALLACARLALGAERATEDADVLQDLFVCMTRAKLPFVPGRDRALAWLEEQLVALAVASPTDLLVARAADGDPDAVARVLQEHGEMLLEEARAALAGSLELDAEDVVQDLGEHLLEGALTFETGDKGGIGFLRRTVRRLARDRQEEGQRVTDEELDALGQEHGEDDEA
jgi:DNA-directed RNA polymerase specialized sigma24 family protein